MTSSSSSSGTTTPAWESGHLIRKLRTARGWTLHQLAFQSGLTDHEIVSLEENQPQKTDQLIRLLRGLEVAFGINMIAAVAMAEKLNKPSTPATDNAGIVLPFVTANQSIHQNSMEWDGSGRLLGTADHAPHLSVLPLRLIQGFLGRPIPEKFLRMAQRKVKSEVQSSFPSPHSLFGHYKRLINAAAKDVYARPLRYQANARHGGAKLVREVTCIKLSENRYETRTHVISKKKHIDAPCCRQHADCSQCFNRYLDLITRSAG